MSFAISLFDPRYSIHLGGFDRRGCTATLNNATATGLTVSGYFSDLADFVTLYLFDTDDLYGHRDNSKYLPVFDLTGVKVDFDLAIVNCFSPVSSKFQSVFQGALQWIKPDGTNSGSTPPALNITSQSGGTAASCTITIGGTPAAFGRLQIIYLGNIAFDYIEDATDTLSSIINSTSANTNGFVGFVKQINDAHTAGIVPFTATGTGTTITITSSLVNIDGNGIQLVCRANNGGATVSPTLAKLTGGVDPTLMHVQLDFSSLSLTSLQQAWLTIGPVQPYDSSGSTATLQAFTALEFSYTLSNITLTDPNSKGPLQIADPSSVVADSQDVWSVFNGTFTQELGAYSRGFSQASSTIGDTVTISYSCSSSHDLYLGTALSTDRGKFTVVLDGGSPTTFDCYFPNLAQQLVCRRRIETSVAAGDHTLKLTVAAKNGSSSGNTCYFDYLQAVVPVSPSVPVVTYPTVSAACDFDTDQTYKIAPSRLLYVFQQLGFQGDIDVYAGVFFALKRRRRGGFFHSATLTVAGTLDPGAGFGASDAFFVNIGGTSLGVAVYPADTLNTVAQRFVDAINGTFVGVYAVSALGVVTVTCLSPINGFTISVSHTTTSATWALGGDLLAGNEGIWEVDPTQTLPLNRGFTDWISDFAGLVQATGLSCTVAFSQELLAPPDANTSGGAWIQRYSDGSTVLTATEFGTWGVGFIQGISGSTVHQTGHGYIVGYVISDGANFYTIATVPDADHYTLVSGLPTVGAQVVAQLQTSQCNFNPATVTTYLTACYVQLAALLAAAGLATPWVQFGEVGWWFFAGGSGPSMAYYDAYTTSAASTALGRALASFSSPNDSPTINSFADADFLAAQIQTHIHTIRVAVLAATASTKFELLWPYDVNYKTAYTSPMGLTGIGGQLNRYVNLPSSYVATGSDIDRWLFEGLAWGTTYRDMSKALETINFLDTDTSLTATVVSYLIPWQIGGCPWGNEWLNANRPALQFLKFWAIDHVILFSWKLPLPVQQQGAN